MTALRVVPLPEPLENEADIEDIVALSDLLCVMLAQPDADTTLDGIHRVMLIIADHAHALRERLLNGSRRARRS